jgi:hypothetical protein
MWWMGTATHFFLTSQPFFRDQVPTGEVFAHQRGTGTGTGTGRAVLIVNFERRGRVLKLSFSEIVKRNFLSTANLTGE